MRTVARTGVEPVPPNVEEMGNCNTAWLSFQGIKSGLKRQGHKRRAILLRYPSLVEGAGLEPATSGSTCEVTSVCNAASYLLGANGQILERHVAHLSVLLDSNQLVFVFKTNSLPDATVPCSAAWFFSEHLYSSTKQLRSQIRIIYRK